MSFLLLVSESVLLFMRNVVQIMLYSKKYLKPQFRRHVSYFPASARNSSALFLISSDAVVDMIKGLAWMPLWVQKGCNVSHK